MGFYNAELKERFLENARISGTMDSLFRNVFDFIAPYEEKHGADICTWGEEETQEVLDKLAGFRSYSSRNRENLLKRYIRWCLANEVPGANGAIFGVSADGISVIRERLLSGPEHLQHCLDSFLSPESDKTADNVLRGYCWLAFAGMTDTDILSTTVDSVDFDNLCVHSGGVSYPLYRESLPCMHVLCEMSCFKYFHDGYGNEFIWRPRKESDRLLRGIRNAEPTLNSIRTRLSTKNVDAFNDKKIDIKLSYYRIWLSGEFYRMYQKERMGEDVDFTYLAVRGLTEREGSGRPYKLDSGVNKRTTESKKRELARNFQVDYTRWKIAYTV